MCYVLLVMQLLRMNGYFPVCHGLHCAVVFSVIHGLSCRRPVYRQNFSFLLRISSCHLFLVICVSVQYVQSSWCAMCCYSYAVAEYEWIFPSLLWILSCVSWSMSVQYFEWSIVLPADSLCISGFFPLYCGLFPVIHIWAFVHHSCMFRVVDVLCAVCYTVAEDEWIFSSLLWIFSCVSSSTPCSSFKCLDKEYKQLRYCN